ncbi:unnamed protein product [Gadus morhua 'NCC']
MTNRSGSDPESASYMPGDSMLLLTLAQPAWCAPFCTSRAGAASRLGPADSQHASWARPGEAPAEGRGSAPVPRALGLWLSGWARRAQLRREPCCHERVHGDRGQGGGGDSADGGEGFCLYWGSAPSPLVLRREQSGTGAGVAAGLASVRSSDSGAVEPTGLHVCRTPQYGGPHPSRTPQYGGPHPSRTPLYGGPHPSFHLPVTVLLPSPSTHPAVVPPPPPSQPIHLTCYRSISHRDAQQHAVPRPWEEEGEEEEEEEEEEEVEEEVRPSLCLFLGDLQTTDEGRPAPAGQMRPGQRDPAGGTPPHNEISCLQPFDNPMTQNHSLFRQGPLGDSVVMPTASLGLVGVAAVSPQPPSTQASPCSCYRRMIIYLDLFN